MSQSAVLRQEASKEDVLPKKDLRIGNGRGLGILVLTQVVTAGPVFLVAWILGGTHIQQVWRAGAVVWPLVILSYLPLLRWRKSDTVIVPVYLAVMVRMFGTLGAVVAVRQIAAPLAPDSWFAYISTFYLTGLVAEAALAVSHLRATVAGRPVDKNHPGR
ncbi:MAG: hypothetical protein Q8M16_02460 [Pirellulaceae bacterium]|nr:hypothetical protein [Pirellulaceae bacterium]